MKKFEIICADVEDTTELGTHLGKLLRGGEVIVLDSDLGGGKTTFVKGLAKGMGVEEVVRSPSFAINFVYKVADGKELHHFDFYRLNEAGIMAGSLGESLGDKNVVVAIEWSGVVSDILPTEKILLKISTDPETEARKLSFEVPEQFAYLGEMLEDYNQ